MNNSTSDYSDERTPTEHMVLMRFMMANFQKLTEVQEATQRQVGALTTHVTGAAMAVSRLAKVLTWSAVLVVVAFVCCLFVVEYTFYAESTRNDYERRVEVNQNQQLREEIWGVISILASKQCAQVSGNTSSATTKQTGENNAE